MKGRLLLSLVLTMVLCFGFGQAAFGAEKFGIGANVSYMGIADTGSGDSVEFDGAALIGLNVTARMNSLFALAVDLGYSSLDIDADAGGAVGTFTTGELTQTPLLVTVQVHLPFFDTIDPYVGAGIGYYFNDFDTSDFLALQGGEIKADDNFAFHLNAGLEFNLTDSIAVYGDLKYLWNEADLSAVGALLNNVQDDLEMRTFIGGIGIKFYF